MSSPQEPLELVCDAPTYLIVESCREIGLESPEDVRWLHAGRFLAAQGGQFRGWTGPTWNDLVEALETQGTTCSCGQRLPSLFGYCFSLSDGSEPTFAFGQCAQCKTVYWREV